MLTVSKSKLKAQMLSIFREIEKSGEDIIVTDHNKPVLRIQPIKQGKTIDELFSTLQGKITYNEDLNATTISEWDEI